MVSSVSKLHTFDEKNNRIKELVAAYGPLAKIESEAPADSVVRSQKHAIKKETYFPCIDKFQLPKMKPNYDPFDMPRYLLTGRKPEEKRYLPKSAIRIHWSQGGTDNVDLICEWLAKKFGPILFTIKEDRHRYIIVYQNTKSCYDTVNAGISPRLMSVSWCDPRFYNHGHYHMYKDYNLYKDPIWPRGQQDIDD